MEPLLYLFVFLLIVTSVVDLWTNGSLFTSIRNKLSRYSYSKVIICPECFSFWIGFILSFLFDPLVGYPGMSQYLLSHVFCGTISFLTTRFLYCRGLL